LNVPICSTQIHSLSFLAGAAMQSCAEQNKLFSLQELERIGFEYPPVAHSEMTRKKHGVALCIGIGLTCQPAAFGGKAKLGALRCKYQKLLLSLWRAFYSHSLRFCEQSSQTPKPRRFENRTPRACFFFNKITFLIKLLHFLA